MLALTQLQAQLQDTQKAARRMEDETTYRAESLIAIHVYQVLTSLLELIEVYKEM